MAIEDRSKVQAGIALVAKFKGEVYRAAVEETEDGKLVYFLEGEIGGKAYSSPSSVGSAVTGSAINGWAFWTLEEEWLVNSSAKNAEKEAKAAARAQKAEDAKVARAVAKAAKAAAAPKAEEPVEEEVALEI